MAATMAANTRPITPMNIPAKSAKAITNTAIPTIARSGRTLRYNSFRRMVVVMMCRPLKVVIQRTLMTCSQFVNDIVVKKFAVSHKNGIVKNEFNVRYQVCCYDHQRVWPHSRDDRIQSGVT